MAASLNSMQIIACYEQLIDRACAVVNNWPGSLWHWPRDNDWPKRLKIKDDKAILEWVEEGDYDSGAFECRHDFPAEMLSWSDDELSEWCKKELEWQKQKEREEAEREKAKNAAREKALYLSLKAKYGE